MIYLATFNEYRCVIAAAQRTVSRSGYGIFLHTKRTTFVNEHGAHDVYEPYPIFYERSLKIVRDCQMIVDE